MFGSHHFTPSPGTRVLMIMGEAVVGHRWE